MTDAPHPRLVSDHFIRQIPFGYAIERDRLRLETHVSFPDDVGLLATLVDIVGGVLVLSQRPAAAVPTVSIDLFGLAALDRPGSLVADARLAVLGSRRASVEVALSIDDQHGWARVELFLLEGKRQPVEMQPPPPLAAGAGLGRPMAEHIGVSMADGGVQIAITPRVHNDVGALQGGATMTLLEAAARIQLEPGESVAAASVSYMRQVRGTTASARVRWRRGNVVVVDVTTDADARVLASATFEIGRAP